VPLRPPTGAGFGFSSAFGGPCYTPTAERLAKGGLKYLRFHTTALCSRIYEGTSAVEPPKTPEEGYTFTEDLANRATTWIRQQQALMPDKPFFVYFAPGATHAPHHVPKEWSDKYKGKFDGGWDKLREETLAWVQIDIGKDDHDHLVSTQDRLNIAMAQQ